MPAKRKSLPKKARPGAKRAGANRVLSKTPAKKSAKSTTAGKGRLASRTAAPVLAVPADPEKLSFNHAMIYSKDVQRSLDFYRDMLGFKLIEEFRHEGICVYARLHAPGGDGTIALHLAAPGVPISSEGVRLYFEIRDVDGFCQKLQKKGFYLTQMPRPMPWGWRHAYMNDPDGHEISVYWAGENRMKKTVMQAAKKAVGKS